MVSPRMAVLTAVGAHISPWMHVFDEMALTLHHALVALGYDSIQTETVHPARGHIVLGANALPVYEGRFPKQSIPPGSIIYNLEQLPPGSPWATAPLLDLYRSHRCWDYSLVGIGHLAAHGITARHCPVGSMPQLERMTRATEDIDILFLGGASPRRGQIIEGLRASGLHVIWPSPVWGRERDALCARAKIVLNLHARANPIFEAVRCVYMLANRRFVVSEDGAAEDEQDDWRPGLVFAPPHALAETCRYYLDHKTLRAQTAECGHEITRARRQDLLLAPLLKDADV